MLDRYRRMLSLMGISYHLEPISCLGSCDARREPADGEDTAARSLAIIRR